MKSRFSKALVHGVLTASLLMTAAALSRSFAQGQSAAPQAASTQGGATQTAPQGETTSGVIQVVDQYRIGAGDILSIRVTAGRLVPELSLDSVEVDECGRIPVASVEQETENEIQAAGKTRTQLAEELRAFYKKYKKNPQVMVMVKEFKSQPVAINGAIMRPGQFQMRRPVRLLELVQFFAGGPTERSSGVIQLARASNFNACAAPSLTDHAAIEFAEFDLKDTLSGVEKANPYLQPGDVITLPEAKEAYVVGNVLRPGPILLKNSTVTVSQAIAMAGGTMPDTKKEKIHLIRRDANGQIGQDILIDLRAVERKEATDIALLPNDIVNVEVAGGKRFLRNIFSSIAPAVGQLPVRVIP